MTAPRGVRQPLRKKSICRNPSASRSAKALLGAQQRGVAQRLRGHRCVHEALAPLRQWVRSACVDDAPEFDGSGGLGAVSATPRWNAGTQAHDVQEVEGDGGGAQKATIRAAGRRKYKPTGASNLYFQAVLHEMNARDAREQPYTCVSCCFVSAFSSTHDPAVCVRVEAPKRRPQMRTPGVGRRQPLPESDTAERVLFRDEAAPNTRPRRHALQHASRQRPTRSARTPPITGREHL